MSRSNSPRTPKESRVCNGIGFNECKSVVAPRYDTGSADGGSGGKIDLAISTGQHIGMPSPCSTRSQDGSANVQWWWSSCPGVADLTADMRGSSMASSPIFSPEEFTFSPELGGTAPADGNRHKMVAQDWPAWALDAEHPCIQVRVDSERGHLWVDAEPQSLLESSRETLLCAEYLWEDDDEAYHQDFHPDEVRRRGETKTVLDSFLEKAATRQSGNVSSTLPRNSIRNDKFDSEGKFKVLLRCQTSSSEAFGKLQGERRNTKDMQHELENLEDRHQKGYEEDHQDADVFFGKQQSEFARAKSVAVQKQSQALGQMATDASRRIAEAESTHREAAEMLSQRLEQMVKSRADRAAKAQEAAQTLKAKASRKLFSRSLTRQAADLHIVAQDDSEYAEQLAKEAEDARKVLQDASVEIGRIRGDFADQLKAEAHMHAEMSRRQAEDAEESLLKMRAAHESALNKQRSEYAAMARVEAAKRGLEVRKMCKTAEQHETRAEEHKAELVEERKKTEAAMSRLSKELRAELQAHKAELGEERARTEQFLARLSQEHAVDLKTYKAELAEERVRTEQLQCRLSQVPEQEEQALRDKEEKLLQQAEGAVERRVKAHVRVLEEQHEKEMESMKAQLEELRQRGAETVKGVAWPGEAPASDSEAVSSSAAPAQGPRRQPSPTEFSAQDTLVLRFLGLCLNRIDHQAFKRELLDQFRRDGMPQSAAAQLRIQLRDGSVIAEISGSESVVRLLRSCVVARPISVMGSTPVIQETLYEQSSSPSRRGCRCCSSDGHGGRREPSPEASSESRVGVSSPCQVRERSRSPSFSHECPDSPDVPMAFQSKGLAAKVAALSSDRPPERTATQPGEGDAEDRAPACVDASVEDQEVALWEARIKQHQALKRHAASPSAWGRSFAENGTVPHLLPCPTPSHSLGGLGSSLRAASTRSTCASAVAPVCSEPSTIPSGHHAQSLQAKTPSWADREWGQSLHQPTFGNDSTSDHHSLVSRQFHSPICSPRIGRDFEDSRTMRWEAELQALQAIRAKAVSPAVPARAVSPTGFQQHWSDAPAAPSFSSHSSALPSASQSRGTIVPPHRGSACGATQYCPSAPSSILHGSMINEGMSSLGYRYYA